MLNYPSFFNGVSAPYEIEQSLRFNSADSAYLSRTPASAGNRRTWTWAGWVKRSKLNNQARLFNADISNADRVEFMLHNETENYMRLELLNGVSFGNFVTSQVFRDASSWYHIVLAVDTTQTTASDRVKIYVNGARVTSFSAETYPDQNQAYAVNATTIQSIGRSFRYDRHFDGYLGDIHFIDGQALDPTDFGEFNADGVWVPIDVTGLTYGTNGFYLKFDPTATNGIGHDHSGNGNNWTASGFTTTPPGNGFYIKDVSTVSGGGSFGGGFDGNLSTQAGSSNFSGEVMTWAPSGGKAYTSSVEIYGGEPAYDQVRINGGSYTSMPGSSWKTIATGSGTITTMDIRDSRGNAAAAFSAIRIDGVILVDYAFDSQYDVLSDTPTTNWCTLNPLQYANYASATPIYTEGNLVFDSTSGGWSGTTGTVSVSSGKWYWEYICAGVTASEKIRNGVYKQGGVLSATGGDIPSSSDVHTYASDGTRWNGSSFVSYGATYTSGDVIGVALDLDAGTLVFYKNNTSQGTAYTGLSGTYSPYFAQSSDPSSTANFGQRAFAYTPPTGFKALNTANLPAPDIADGSDYFQTVLYTGDGNETAHDITVADNSGNAWQPDMVWIKNRVFAANPGLADSVRGATRFLTTPYTAAEILEDANGYITSFNSDGFTVIKNPDYPALPGYTTNKNGDAYVAWNWKTDNTSGSSNTDGSITSTVSANLTAGFSIVSYTGVAGDNISATIGHGLGVAPDFIIIKNRDWVSSGAAWQTYHSSIPSTGTSPVRLSQSLSLDTTDAASGNDFKDQMNNTLPTSTVFSVSSHDGVSAANRYRTYGRADNYIAYCFAEVEGYSKFGSYTGNGSNDGTFVYTGHKPRWIMYKRTDSAGSWIMYDTARNTYNPAEGILSAEAADAETFNVTFAFDILSNGFKFRGYNTGSINASGGTYVYMSFAENPFGGSGVSPATAR